MQACVSTKIGGLGVRRTIDHAVGAFAASWHESMQTAREQWSAPVSCSPSYRPQSVASTAVDRAAFDGLISRSSLRDAQRLRRLDVSHANAWISALPSVWMAKIR